MKKIVLLIALLFIGLCLQAQNITTTCIQYGSWISTETDEGVWEMTPISQYVTTFKISKTSIKHITDEIKTTYLIDKDTYVINGDQIEMEVKSSETETYYFVIINDKIQTLQFIYKDKNQLKMALFTY